MSRKLFVFFTIAAIFVVGESMISQVAQAVCSTGYPVNCGSYCCESGYSCVGGSCCPVGYPTLCGGLCCEVGNACIDGLCCPAGYTVSCRGQCCEAGSWCIDGICSPPGYPVNCGDYFCEAGHVCTDDGGCCPEDYPVSCKDRCCGADSECCEGGCCPENYRECEECGKLFINSVESGLRNSAILRTYVFQSRQSYANCIREIRGSCENICGKQLFNILPRCDIDDYNDAGHRACVEEALSGAILECERLQGQ
jgi:hypothetical protein